MYLGITKHDNIQAVVMLFVVILCYTVNSDSNVNKPLTELPPSYFYSVMNSYPDSILKNRLPHSVYSVISLVMNVDLGI